MKYELNLPLEVCGTAGLCHLAHCQLLYLPTEYWTSRVRPITRPAIEHDRRYTDIVISEQAHVLTGYSQTIRTLSTNKVLIELFALSKLM
jgi:hypothetical protein